MLRRAVQAVAAFAAGEAEAEGQATIATITVARIVQVLRRMVI